jgi:hypothetical protein
MTGSDDLSLLANGRLGGGEMLARLVGIILGLILSTSGYVIAGWGQLGSWAAHLDLGPFEPHRPFVGGAAAILGGVLIVAALTPRPKPKSRKKPAPMAFGLEAELAPVAAPSDHRPAPAPLHEAAHAEPIAAPVMQVAAEPRHPPAPSIAQAAAPEPRPAPPPPAAKVGAEFTALRERMVSLCRAESWAEAARVLMSMKSTARNDREMAILYRDLGDFARGQGQMDDAAEAYETAVSYARDVRKAEPQDLTALDLLAGTLAGVGDVAEAEGRLDNALSAFEESLALRRSAGGREAHDPGAQRALSVSLERLADLREDRGHRMRALDLYRESYDVAARLAAADPARFGADLAATRQRLAELEAKVGV